MHRIFIWITALALVTLPVAHAESNSFSGDNEEHYYMWTRSDMRMCPAPECGGFYVKALNRIRTLCADKSVNKDCQVLALDFSLLDLDGKEQALFQKAFTDGLGIVKGNLFQSQQNGFLLPTLILHEAWLAQGGSVPRKWGFFHVHDTGIQCITTPCLSIEEGFLNLPGSRTIAGVDLHASGAEEEQIIAGYQEMKSSGVIATGRHRMVHGPAGFSRILVATEFYLPVAKVEVCGSTVCLPGQICCNASCGICTPPDGACIQMECD